MTQFRSGDGAPTHLGLSSELTSGSEEASELSVDTVWKARVETEAECPLYLSSVQAGFPSPADDYVETTLDLNTSTRPSSITRPRRSSSASQAAL
jgi:DNA polymerase V